MKRSRSKRAKQTLLGRVRSKKAPTGPGSRLAAALQKVFRRDTPTPAQHILIKRYWRRKAERGPEHSEIRLEVQKYLERLRKQSRRSDDQRVREAELIADDLREIGIKRNELAVFLEDPKTGRMQRWTLSAWERFLDSPVYKPVRDQFTKAKVKFELSRITQERDQGEVFAVFESEE